MRKPIVPLLLAIVVAFATGCSTTYYVRLNNSDVLTAKSRPKLVDGYYVFKDAQGREVRVNELRVREIEAR